MPSEKRAWLIEKIKDIEGRMKQTMGIVLLAFLGGCSAFDSGMDGADSYYHNGRQNMIGGPPQTTWKDNDRYRMSPSAGTFASAGTNETASARPGPTYPSDPIANPVPLTAPPPGESTAQPISTLPLPGSLATASLAGAVPVSHTVQNSETQPSPERIPDEIKGPDFAEYPGAEEQRAPMKGSPELTLPDKDTAEDARDAKDDTEDMIPQKDTGPGVVPPKPLLVNSCKVPAAAGKSLEPMLPDTNSKADEAVPGKQDKATQDLVMLDRQSQQARPPAVRMVKTKRITINYEVKDVGPSGISGVELWCTQDGKTWTKRDMSRKIKPPYVVDVEEEGLYGFTLLAKNGIGLGPESPKSGDLPQIWVEVDMTRPVVHLTGVNASSTGKVQNVIVHWKANDKNLGPRPITLSYAPCEEGPWQVMAANVPNTGRYVWPMPPETPARFLVRVEAADLVGNVGSAQTPKPVLMDRAQPVVNILNVDSDGK
jgi:hypothetical protein